MGVTARSPWVRLTINLAKREWMSVLPNSMGGTPASRLEMNNESELTFVRVVKRTEPTRVNRLAPKWGWIASQMARKKTSDRRRNKTILLKYPIDYPGAK